MFANGGTCVAGGETTDLVSFCHVAGKAVRDPLPKIRVGSLEFGLCVCVCGTSGH